MQSRRFFSSGRASIAVGLLLAIGQGCGEGEAEEEEDVWEAVYAGIEEAGAANAHLADVETAIREGYVLPTMVNYNPIDPREGMGACADSVVLDPTAYPDESIPFTVRFGVDEEGGWIPAALAYYYEVDQPDEEHAEVFGVPMAGLMDGHVPGQGSHYDLQIWPFEVSPPADDPFAEYNANLPTPDWYLAFEPTLFGTWGLHQEEDRTEGGYLEELPCESGPDGATGSFLRNPELVGVLDPLKPDTLMVASLDDLDLDWGDASIPTIDGGSAELTEMLLGAQWTAPADTVSEPPTLFGRTFSGPDASGDYTLRIWLGLANPDGWFVEHHPFVSCPG